MRNFIRGSAKLVPRNDGDLINLTLNLNDINQLLTKDGYVAITISKRKELGQFGDTHYVYENEEFFN